MASRKWRKTPKQAEATALVASHAHTLLAGGSRSGKSALGVYLTFVRAFKAPKSRHTLVRQIFRDAVNKLGMDTVPAVIDLAFPGVPIRLDKAKWYWTLPNGSEIWLNGLDDAGDRDARILGSEYSTIMYDEADQIAYDSVLLARTRLAQKNNLVNREIFTCNPPSQSHWLYRLYVEGIDPLDRKPLRNPDDYAWIRMNPADNVDNIDRSYLRQLEMLPRAKRDRFLRGLWGNDSQTVIFNRAWFGQNRVDDIPADEDGEPAVRRVAIGIDPAGSSGRKSDDTGIVVDVLAADSRVYTVSAESLRVPPDAWAARVCDLYRTWGADTVVAETNFGADMVVSVIRNVDPAVHVTPVRASRGKAVRAEPVAALYERGLVCHVGAMDELEDQLMTYDTVAPPKISPGVADAQVWAVTHLLGTSFVSPRVSTETSAREENGAETEKQAADMSFRELVDDDELWTEL